MVGQAVNLNSRISNIFLSKRDVPSYGVYIIAYEWILDYLYPEQKRPLPTPFETVWVGGVAGQPKKSPNIISSAYLLISPEFNIIKVFFY